MLSYYHQRPRQGNGTKNIELVTRPGILLPLGLRDDWRLEERFMSRQKIKVKSYNAAERRLGLHFEVGQRRGKISVFAILASVG